MLLKQAGGSDFFSRLDQEIIDFSNQTDHRNSEYSLSNSLFATLVVEHANAPEYPRMTRDRLADFTVDDNRLVLGNAPVEPFQEDSGVLAVDDEFHVLPVDLPVKDPLPILTVEADDRGMKKIRLALEEDYSLPQIQVSRSDSNVIVDTEVGRQVVEPDEEARLLLQSRSVVVADKKGDTKNVKVMPKIRVHNYGPLHVFGASGKRLLPLHSDDEYAKARVSAIQANSREQVEVDEDNELLIIDEKSTEDANTN